MLNIQQICNKLRVQNLNRNHFLLNSINEQDVVKIILLSLFISATVHNGRHEADKYTTDALFYDAHTAKYNE